MFIWLPAVVIGLGAATLSAVGFGLGTGGRHLGRWADVLAGRFCYWSDARFWFRILRHEHPSRRPVDTPDPRFRNSLQPLEHSIEGAR